MKLSAKFLLVSGITLVLFCFASFGILFKAQLQQSAEEMDHLLKNESLALSTLVTTTRSERFDFEVSSAFLLRYQQHNPNGFFRFISPDNNGVFKESAGAPAIGCDDKHTKKSITRANRMVRTTFRVRTLFFKFRVKRSVEFLDQWLLLGKIQFPMQVIQPEYIKAY